jgi:hypothetical protein
MNRKSSGRSWSMAMDRELMTLAKMHTLRTIADRMERSPGSILKRAARLGLNIKRPRRALVNKRLNAR